MSITEETVGTGEQIDVAACGKQIEQLLDAAAASGPVARDRAEELVRLLVQLYGTGLERILTLLHEAGRLDDEVLSKLCDDELISGLMVLHGLHPYSLEDRVALALDKVRPYLGSHGGDVELIEITSEGVVRLGMLGSCDGCPSSSVTLSLAVESAIEAAAPEVSGIEVVETPASTAKAATPGFIPVESLSVRLHERDGTFAGWKPAAAVEDVPASGLRRVDVSGMSIVICRVGSNFYAFRDRCPVCEYGLEGASIERQLGGARTIVLSCRTCGSHFDLTHARAGIDGDPDLHLDPLPLLERSGVLRVAVPGGEALTLGVAT